MASTLPPGPRARLLRKRFPSVLRARRPQNPERVHPGPLGALAGSPLLLQAEDRFFSPTACGSPAGIRLCLFRTLVYSWKCLELDANVFLNSCDARFPM